jgi:segregation and condensation protein B
MSLKAQLEAIIYAAETPVTLDNMLHLVKGSVANGGPADEAAIKSQVRSALEELSSDYASANHGIEIRQIASGYRMSTKPEHHDVVRAFAKSLKPPIRLSMPALETLAVIAYKQPVTVPEISEIRGVDSSGVIATLLERKLITTAGRKAVIGRPILYKSTKEFLLRFGLKDVSELPSMEEFEKLVAESFQSDLLPVDAGDTGDDTMTKSSGGSFTNDGVPGKHGKPSSGLHGHQADVELELDVEATETDEFGSEDNDGVAGQHGKPTNS